MTSRQPSLLVFTLDPARDCARQRLLPERFEGLERAIRGHSLERAVAAGLASGCRVEVSSPEPLALGDPVRWAEQRGEGFGERFRHALSQAHGRSEGPLVVIGSDAPGLSAAHLEAALEELEAEPDRVVLGPSPDGGFYLLATRRPLDAELASVRWCRGDTLRSLIAALEASGIAVSLIAPLEDLDRPRDLLAWLTRPSLLRSSWSGLVTLVRRLLAMLCRPQLPPTLGRLRPAFATVATGRGPPR
jgi:CTP:molybdopterin cytidylyltransferase MocA